MATGDWWDVSTYVVWYAGLGANMEDLTNQEDAHAWALQMIANMADQEWTQSWMDTSFAIADAVNKSTTNDAATYWYNLAIVWASYDGWAQSEGIPHWRELGDWFAAQAGFAVDWQAIQDELVENVADAVKPESVWDQVKPYALGAGAIWTALAVYKASK